MTKELMWIVFGLVVAAVLIISVLSKTRFNAKKVAFIGISAGLSYIAYLYFRIPIGHGTSIHLGNTFVALTALLLDGVSGGLAGAIGLSLADIAAGDPGYAITTFILKFIIGVTCGTVAHRVFKINTLKKEKQYKKFIIFVVISAAAGLLLNVFTDPVLGYFRNRFIFGQDVTLASIGAKIASFGTLINSILSTAFASAIYLALKPALDKADLLSNVSADEKVKDSRAVKPAKA